MAFREKKKKNRQVKLAIFERGLLRRKLLRYWICKCLLGIRMQLACFTTVTNICIVKVNIYFHILFLEVFISNDS